MIFTEIKLVNNLIDFFCGHLLAVFGHSSLHFFVIKEATVVGIESLELPSQGLKLTLIKAFDENVETGFFEYGFTFEVLQFLHGFMMKLCAFVFMQMLLLLGFFDPRVFESFSNRNSFLSFCF